MLPGVVSVQRYVLLVLQLRFYLLAPWFKYLAQSLSQALACETVRKGLQKILSVQNENLARFIYYSLTRVCSLTALRLFTPSRRQHKLYYYNTQPVDVLPRANIIMKQKYKIFIKTDSV